MMEMHLIQSSIIWTRSIVLVLSVIIVIVSLSIYNTNAIPIFTLVESDRSALLQHNHSIIYDMIQDRRLIATLVAAQASILCPLFLLLGAPTTHHLPLDIEEEETEYHRFKRMDLWRTLIEQLCQFLMPLGLALSWLFCILFDKKTHMALRNQGIPEDRVTVVTVLKYIVVVVLLFEVLAIWCSTLIKTGTKGTIQLNEEEYTVYTKKVEENV
ncbi:hypothetical protein K501DRAFT_298806 [Backusella circina FSU 941]|nr:hypothetical protein K501DRAFT_298806 [Backusella circina FSU 941]